MINNKFVLKLITCLILFSLIAALFSAGGCSEQEKTANVIPSSFKKIGFQLEKPQKDEEIAIIKTNFGEIKIRFFPEVAPKAVENFKTHSKNSYYNNLIFHRVIKDFMIQTGDPKGDGTGGESIWKKPFEDEFYDNLFNIRGSVSMANAGKKTNGSQFFINQTTKDKVHDVDKIKSDEIKNFYKENGGNFNLDKKHTVFGQVFEGMDVVDKIASCNVNKNNKPIEDIKIENIEIEKF